MSLDYKYVLSTEDSPSGNNSIELSVPPEGYDQIDYSFFRGESEGVFHDIIPDLKFVRDGRDYLIEQKKSKGIYAVVYCTIYKKNLSTDSYEFFYQGRVDMGNSVISRDYFTCTLEAEGLQQIFVNSTSKKQSVSTYLDSAGVEQSSFVDTAYKTLPILKVYESENDLAIYNEVLNPSLSPQGLLDVVYFSIGCPVVTQNEFQVFDYPLFVKNTSLIQDAQFLFEVKESGDHTFDINLEVEYYDATTDPAFRPVVNIVLYRVSGSVPTVLQTTSVPFVDIRNIPLSAVSSSYFEVSADYQVVTTLAQGERVYLQGEVTYAQPTLLSVHYYRCNLSVDDISTIKISANTLYEDTVIPSVPIYEAMLSVAQKITGQTDILRSDLFGRTDSPDIYPEDGEGSLGVYIDGNRLRGISDKTISVSWDDLINDLDLKYCIGWGVEQEGYKQVIRVEKRDYFYQNSQSIDLLSSFNTGRQKPILYFENVTETMAEDRLFSDITISYPRPENQNINGLDEFNTARDFNTPIDAIDSQYSLNTTIRAAGSEIELQRRKKLESTTDSKIDDDLFSCAVVRDGLVFENETNELITTTGVINSEDIYNVRYAPARSLRRHGQWINTFLLLAQNPVIFSGGTGNYTMSSQQGVDIIIGENADFSKTELGAPVVLSDFYNLEVPLTNQDVQVIKNNPYSYLSFKVKEQGVIKSVNAHLNKMELIKTSTDKDNFRLELAPRFGFSTFTSGEFSFSLTSGYAGATEACTQGGVGPILFYSISAILSASDVLYTLPGQQESFAPAGWYHQASTNEAYEVGLNGVIATITTCVTEYPYNVILGSSSESEACNSYTPVSVVYSLDFNIVQGSVFYTTPQVPTSYVTDQWLLFLSTDNPMEITGGVGEVTTVGSGCTQFGYPGVIIGPFLDAPSACAETTPTTTILSRDPMLTIGSRVYSVSQDVTSALPIGWHKNTINGLKALSIDANSIIIDEVICGTEFSYSLRGPEVDSPSACLSIAPDFTAYSSDNPLIVTSVLYFNSGLPTSYLADGFYQLVGTGNYIEISGGVGEVIDLDSC